MEKKITTEELWKDWERNPEQIYKVVVTGDLFINPYYSEVDIHSKRSLARKAFRYVASESVKGTIPATLVSSRLGFYEMNHGDVMPIGEYSDLGWIGEFTFTDREGNLIHVDAKVSWELTFRSIKGSKTVKRPSGLHMDYIHTCADIPRMYDDPRWGWRIEE